MMSPRTSISRMPHLSSRVMPRMLPLAGLVAVLLFSLAGSAAAKTKPQYYVSLGYSYAVGWQGPAEDVRGPTKQGFANQIVPLAKKKGYQLKLVNFGCGGATTTSILESKGCPEAGGLPV